MSYEHLKDLDMDEVGVDTHQYLLTSQSIAKDTLSTRSRLITTPKLQIASLELVPYDRGNRPLVLLGLLFSLVVGFVFIAFGIVIYVISGSWQVDEKLAEELRNGTPSIVWHPERERNIAIPLSPIAAKALELSLSVLATLCTEATGYVHGTTLKWGLAKEGRLAFNANLRLLSGTKGLFSVNGPIFNTIFAITIIFSYAASSSIILDSGFYNFTVISYLPSIILGIVLTIQAALGFVAVHHTPVPTWSSCPLDMTSALIHYEYVRHRPNRCMLSVSKSENPTDDPVFPSLRQPSPMESHKVVGRVVWLIWGMVGMWIIFGGILFPWRYGIIYWHGVAPPAGILWASLLSAVVQSFVTIGLHCCELVTTLARDEMIWRAASSEKGTRRARNPLKTALGSWQTCGLLVFKPVVHWCFGLSVALSIGYGWELSPFGMWVLAAGMALVAVFITTIARRHPSGPQPAAYGHFQTLADLVDEWSMTMHWGHKKDDRGVEPWPVCHAGTREKGRLPLVKMNCLYA
ncbi:hypothetical protein FRB96_009522 [Tulasnella sp. 330]|nr:hypothetical protein FRB96_009522 [Tulasnella sp. 330]KAG8875382.1 hypothetical protein FRB97_005171 [Tulasnella sp. 331]